VFFFVGHLRLLHEVFLVSLLFLQGPEIRTGFLKDGKPIKLTKGQEITVTTDYDIKGDENMIAMSYKKLPVDVKPGNVILCADGTISLAVLSCDPDAGTVRCRCENTAMLGERKNCNLPGIVVDLPTLTEKDKEDILGWGVPNDIDMIALSFVRKGSDLVTVRQVLGQHAKRIKLMSKVCIYYRCRPLKGYISYISVHNLARLHFLFCVETIDAEQCFLFASIERNLPILIFAVNT
jgi:hypothetical protein